MVKKAISSSKLILTFTKEFYLKKKKSLSFYFQEILSNPQRTLKSVLLGLLADWEA